MAMARNFYNYGRFQITGMLNFTEGSIVCIKLKLKNPNQIEFEMEISTENVLFKHNFQLCNTVEYCRTIISELNRLHLKDLINNFLIWNISRIYLKIPHNSAIVLRFDKKPTISNIFSAQQYVNEEFKLIFKEKHYDLVPCPDKFYCGNCSSYCPPFSGIVLQECLHLVCRKCLYSTVKKFVDCPFNSKDTLNDLIPCVYVGCTAFITQREKRGILIAFEFRQEQKQTIEKQYDQILQLNKLNLVTNNETFECEICFIECAANDGVILQNCLHQCCKQCILAIVESSLDLIIKCPFTTGNIEGGGQLHVPQQCIGTIEQHEIREIMNKEQFEIYMDKFTKLSLQLAGSISCFATVNCPGIWFQDNEDDTLFRCLICKEWNCIVCKANHQTLTCTQYKDILSGKYDLNEIHIQELLYNCLAMECSHCKAIIMKTTGCDGLDCRFCKTKLCWATKGPRWGKLGKDDRSGGCHCGENGKRCHPNCQNCH